MAYADYLHCAVCDRKTIYDADLNYDSAVEYGMLHDIVTLCPDCAKTHSLQVVNAPNDKKCADFLPVETETF